MQLQYDAGVIRGRPDPTGSSLDGATSNGHRSTGTTAHSNGTGSPTRKGPPQRLLRISAKGIVPASPPTSSASHQPDPQQELEQLELQSQYAEAMSLCDSELRIKPKRVVQVRETMEVSNMAVYVQRLLNV